MKTKVRAPGKLLFTGAYAVLEGAPALVCAVDRYAFADISIFESFPSPEMKVAFTQVPVPKVDTSQLYEGRRKLGLGSSSAALVAALGAALVSKDLPINKDAIFDLGREAHAKAQGGGSGVDVAASTYGGVLRYQLGFATPMKLPEKSRFWVFRAGYSSQTSELLKRVKKLKEENLCMYSSLMKALSTSSESAIDAKDFSSFLSATNDFRLALLHLSRATGDLIVPDGFKELGDLAEREGGVFWGSGAGGGDVGVYLAEKEPSYFFFEEAAKRDILPLNVGIDYQGVTRDETHG